NKADNLNKLNLAMISQDGLVYPRQDIATYPQWMRDAVAGDKVGSFDFSFFRNALSSGHALLPTLDRSAGMLKFVQEKTSDARDVVVAHRFMMGPEIAVRAMEEAERRLYSKAYLQYQNGTVSRSVRGQSVETPFRRYFMEELLHGQDAGVEATKVAPKPG